MKVQSSEFKEREGQAHLSGPSVVIGEEVRQVPVDEVRQVPRVAQLSQHNSRPVLSSECEVKGPTHLTGPSMEILGEEVSQPQAEEVRKAPRVAQLSSECEVREGSAHLPGPSLEKGLNIREKI